MTRKAPTFALTVLLAVLNGSSANGQVQPSILTIDTENCVIYQQDVSDVSQFASKAGNTPPALFRNFEVEYLLGDIVAVNGEPAKGLYAAREKPFSPTRIPIAAAEVRSLTPPRTRFGRRRLRS